jgi:anthranilate phosphoribosyltransferase
MPAESIVLMNAGAGLYLAGKAETFVEGFDIARESIKSGDALRKLGQLAEAVRI